MRLPPLTTDQILNWADGFHERTGDWPTIHSGNVDECPEEKWQNLDAALKAGSRGLLGGSSLAKLLVEYRGIRKTGCLSKLSDSQILQWADVHYGQTGKWRG